MTTKVIKSKFKPIAIFIEFYYRYYYHPEKRLVLSAEVIV